MSSYSIVVENMVYNKKNGIHEKLKKLFKKNTKDFTTVVPANRGEM